MTTVLTLALTLLPLVAETTERTFELTYVAELDVPQGSNRLQMWIPYPSRSDYQDIRLVSIDAPLPTKVYQEYTYRNSMLFLSTSGYDQETLRVEMTFRVTRRERVESDYRVLEDPEGYVEARERGWMRPGADEVVEEAVLRDVEALVGERETVSDKARALFDYVVENQGDADAFISMCRAARIPARAGTGLSLPSERGEGEIEGYQRWAEVYVPGFGWVPVDIAGARMNPDRHDDYFGAHDENRVELSVGRDIKLNPQQSGPPLPFFIFPYAEIDGEPVVDVRGQFFYKDLELMAE